MPNLDTFLAGLQAEPLHCQILAQLRNSTRAAMEANDGARLLTAREICSAIPGYSDTHVGRMLTRLIKEGLVVKLDRVGGNTRYSVTSI
jgi:DNA-binding transcriptional ArsR family regulator